ncbi:hypothetical protein [Streptomyces sp. NPDC006510]|uniref:hypothetical protein n=1 Tax=Streptomyces sp. NPDC006510 TaxID=3155600 RepID=UPI0033B10192
MTGARPPRRHADDGQDPSDADRAAELRAALQRVLPVFAYCAGREAADDPQQAAVVLAAADAVTSALARTAPRGTRSPLEAGMDAADLGVTPTTGPSCEGVRDLIVALLTSHHLVSHAAALREPPTPVCAMAGSSSASATATTSGKITASRPTTRHHSRSSPASPPATRCRRRGQISSRSHPYAPSHHRTTTA